MMSVHFKAKKKSLERETQKKTNNEKILEVAEISNKIKYKIQDHKHR
jgi:hypothetical protein